MWFNFHCLITIFQYVSLFLTQNTSLCLHCFLLSWMKSCLSPFLITFLSRWIVWSFFLCLWSRRLGWCSLLLLWLDKCRRRYVLSSKDFINMRTVRYPVIWWCPMITLSILWLLVILAIFDLVWSVATLVTPYLVWSLYPVLLSQGIFQCL